MPTVHYVKREFLNQHDLQELPWSMGLDNGNNRNASLSGQDRTTLTLMQSQIERPSSTHTQAQMKSGNIGLHLPNGKNNKKEDGRLASTAQHVFGDQSTCAAGSASIRNLKRKSDEQICLVKLNRSKTEHLAFELHNPDNPDETGITVWVEWISSGKRECIWRHEIVKRGLRPRKRQKPTRFIDRSSSS